MSGDRNVAEGWGRALTAVTLLSCSLCLIDELHLLSDRGQLNLARHSADRFTSFLDICATLARATLPELRKYTHPLLTLCYRPWKYQAQVPKEHQQPSILSKPNSIPPIHPKRHNAATLIPHMNIIIIRLYQVVKSSASHTHPRQRTVIPSTSITSGKHLPHPKITQA